MHIEFLLAAREDFQCGHGALSIGSAPDNGLVLAVNQAAPHHVRIEQDRRGWVLRLLPAAGHVYVNARPVRECALLRAGDVLSIGDCRLLLCADEDPALRPDLPPVADAAHCTVALRAVAGPWSGRVVPVTGHLDLGPRGRVPLDLPPGEGPALGIGWRDGHLVLDVRDPSTVHPVRLNGVRVHGAKLRPGDQIGVAMHRFVVEAPGLRAEPDVSRLPAATPAPASTSASASGHTGGWWLIVTATVLALGLALLLSVRF